MNTKQVFTVGIFYGRLHCGALDQPPSYPKSCPGCANANPGTNPEGRSSADHDQPGGRGDPKRNDQKRRRDRQQPEGDLPGWKPGRRDQRGGIYPGSTALAAGGQRQPAQPAKCPPGNQPTQSMGRGSGQLRDSPTAGSSWRDLRSSSSGQPGETITRIRPPRLLENRGLGS